MASSGLFLLLLVSFLICSQSVLHAFKDQEHHFLLKRGNEKQLKTIANDIVKGLKKIEPLIELIPCAGTYINAFIKVLPSEEKDPGDVFFALKDEFNKLNNKLDSQLITTTWNIWASGPYQEAESNIRLAWKNLNELSDKCKKNCFPESEKQKNMDLFKELHKNLVFAPDKLHILLTTQQPSFMMDFKTLLTDHARCHEQDIEGFAQLISSLMYMSNTINVFYYRLNGINKAKEMAQMTFEMMSVMFKIQRFCILNPEKYITKDIIDLIDENQDRQQLAKDIKTFLDKTYNRYDWIVVAFITRNSKYSMFYNRFLNRHYLEGFTEVTKGEVSVAVAKQIKGSYTMAEKVKQDIKKCTEKSINCEDIIKTLQQCRDNDELLSSKFTAVHAYNTKSHDSAETDEFIDTEDKTMSHIYTGDCKKYKIFEGGHFRVMIKSDEELIKEDPCKNVKCGGDKQGECVRLENVQKATCVCKEGYIGSKCDISQEEFIKAINKVTKNP